MSLTKEESRVLLNLDSNLIPEKKERYRKELLELLRIVVTINEASHRLSFITMDKRITDLVRLKLDKLVDSHLHAAFRRYYDLILENEESDG